MKTVEVDSGKRGGVSTELADRVEALEREVGELRQINEILRKASAYFTQAELTPVPAMIWFIDDHRDAYGVEPICRVLPVTPSTYSDPVAQRLDPARLSAPCGQTSPPSPRSLTRSPGTLRSTACGYREHG